MKPTIKVSISGIVFILENDAYACLKNYLDRLESSFSNTNEGREIIDDIELRMAELFSAQIRSSDQGITLSIVEETIRTIGSVGDIIGDDSQAARDTSTSAKEQKPAKKRLFRDIDHRVIGGVCSGLAAYFSIDRVFVRLGFVLVFLFSSLVHTFIYYSSFSRGLSIISIYIILWIVMPAARTMKEKMTMRKEPISPAQNYDDGYVDAHRGDFGSVLGRIVGGFFRVIAWIILGIMAFVALVLLLSLPAALVTGNAIFGDLGYMDLSNYLQQYSSIPLWLMVLLITLVICLPLIGAIYSICKWMFKFKTKIRFGLILLITWLVALFSLVGIGIFMASNSADFPEGLFSKASVTNYMEERPLSAFSTLNVSGNFEVIGVKSDTNYLKIETNNKLIPHIHTQVEGKTVKISYNVPHGVLRNASRSKLYVYFTDLEKIYLSGTSSFSCADTLVPAQFYMQISGTGKGKLILMTSRAAFEMVGASKLTVSGRSTGADMDISGASKIDAFDFVVDSLNLDLSGAGKVQVHVTNYLKVDASGAAVIEYKGTPTMNIDKSGIVKIKKVNEKE